MTNVRGRAMSLAILALAMVWVGVACQSSGQAPAGAGDPAHGVTLDNGTDTTVTVVYERPDEVTEPLADLEPDGHIVIDSIFAGRDGLCRTGRLVAKTSDGTEIDELYLVCRGRTWTIEKS